MEIFVFIPVTLCYTNKSRTDNFNSQKESSYMKFVIQRVKEAKVVVDGKITGQIGKGFLVFIGVSNEDTREIADKLVKKLLGLRIFKDGEGKTNLALEDVNGELLLVSQFTLYADCKKRKPSFFYTGGSPGFRQRYVRVHYWKMS